MKSIRISRLDSLAGCSGSIDWREKSTGIVRLVSEGALGRDNTLGKCIGITARDWKGALDQETGRGKPVITGMKNSSGRPLWIKRGEGKETYRM